MQDDALQADRLPAGRRQVQLAVGRHHRLPGQLQLLKELLVVVRLVGTAAAAAAAGEQMLLAPCSAAEV